MENSTNNKNEAFKILQNDLIKILPVLEPFEQDVLTSRFGINCEFSKTLEDVEKEFSITRVQIRQIEAKALRKIKKLREERGEIKKKQSLIRLCGSLSKKKLLKF